MKTAIFNSHKFEKSFLEKANYGRHEFVFFDTHLTSETAAFAKGCDTVSLFVSDEEEGIFFEDHSEDRLPLIKNYASTEDEVAQIKIHELTIEVYMSLSFPVVFFSIVSPQKRMDFILNNILINQVKQQYLRLTIFTVICLLALQAHH